MRPFLNSTMRHEPSKTVKILAVAITALTLCAETGFAAPASPNNDQYQAPLGSMPDPAMSARQDSPDKVNPPTIGVLANQNPFVKSIDRPTVMDGAHVRPQAAMKTGNDFNWLSGGGG